VAGARVTAQSLQDFLNFSEVRKVLPPRQTWDQDPVTCFKGKFPMQTARRFYGDRWVAIGDAAGLLRPFKGKGINTAILTGMRAAYTMFDYGISRRAFRNFHAKCRDVTADLPYGKLVRFLALRLASWKILNPILELAGRNRRLADALFNSVSAHQNYRMIVREMADRRLILQTTGAIFRYLLRRMTGPPRS
jgi:flavin-dependent dehydrogenase